jgi:hypothetical protein
MDVLVSSPPCHIPTWTLALPLVAAEAVTKQQCSEVYIRKGTKVPYQLVEHHLKTFTVQMGDKMDVVSLDCMKPNRSGPFQKVEPPRQGQSPRIAAFSAHCR